MMALGHLCLRYTVLGCFITLGVSGIAVCATGGLFTYQLHEYGYQNVDIENIEVSSAILIALGLVTLPLAIYFWWFLDNKYNCAQFVMFTVIMLVLSSLEAFAGILAMVKYEELDRVLSVSLEDSLVSPKLINIETALNHTEIKMNCCNYNETVNLNFVPWDCCDLERLGGLDNTTRVECEHLYGRECRHMTINRCRSILIHVFLLALCSVAFQILVILTLLHYARLKKKEKAKNRVSLLRKTSET